MNIDTTHLTQANHEPSGPSTNSLLGHRVVKRRDSWPENKLIISSGAIPTLKSLNKMYMAPSRSGITISPFKKAKDPFAPTKTSTDQQASAPEKPKPEKEEEETISLASVENPAADKEGLLSSDKTDTHGFDLRPLAAAQDTARSTNDVTNKEETEKADEWWEPKEAYLEESHDMETEEDFIEHEEIEEELIEIEEETDTEEDEFEDSQRLDSTYDVPCDDDAFTEEQNDDGHGDDDYDYEEKVVDDEQEHDNDMSQDPQAESQCMPEASEELDSTPNHWDPTAFWRQLDTNFVIPALDDDERIELSCSMDEMTDENDEHMEADSLQYMREDRDNREDDTGFTSKQEEFSTLLQHYGMEDRVSNDGDDTSFASVADSLVLARPNYRDHSSALSNDELATTTTTNDSQGTFGKNFVVQTDRQKYDEQMTESSSDNTPAEWSSVTLSPVRVETTKKSIEWERPEWAKQPSLRSISSKPKTNTITWEKPTWTHVSPLRKTDRGAALRSGKEIITKPALPMDVDESDHE